MTGEWWTAVSLAFTTFAILWDWSVVTADDATFISVSNGSYVWSSSSVSLIHIYFPHSSQCLHHCLSRQTKVIQVSLVWFGSRPLKTNTCKPYNMVICSGWGKERGFINNGANRAHIELRFGFGGRRGAHCRVRWNRGYSIRGWLLFQKGTRGTYRLSVSRHWQPRRLTLRVSPMGEMGRRHSCAYIHVYMNT